MHCTAPTGARDVIMLSHMRSTSHTQLNASWPVQLLAEVDETAATTAAAATASDRRDAPARVRSALISVRYTSPQSH